MNDDEKKDRRFTACLTEDEDRMLRVLARDNGVSSSAVLRLLIRREHARRQQALPLVEPLLGPGERA